MAWPDGNTLPGETPEAALRRRVAMHEFLAPGGVRTVDKGTKAVTYSTPVDPTTTPQCPWHDGDCAAWRELVEGRGTGRIFSPSIVERRAPGPRAPKPRGPKPGAPKAPTPTLTPTPTPTPTPVDLSAGLGDVIDVEGGEDD